jgi:D-alanyl-D-alanine dipeptidase
MKCVCFCTLAFVWIALFSCSPGSGKEPLRTDGIPAKNQTEKSREAYAETAEIPDMLVHHPDTLVRADAFSDAIFWDLKYATSDNFMHRVLYDTLKAVYIQKNIAARLAKCQETLSKIDPDLHLLVYDGLRPLSVQWEMWTALDTIPAAQRGKFVSNPRNGSVHNYGAAVDITICDANRKPLDMGAGYDDIRRIAYPGLEAQFLASGELTEQQVANRRLLRRVMRSQGFINIPTEWWHFNAYPRAVVKGKYRIVENELK